MSLFGIASNRGGVRGRCSIIGEAASHLGGGFKEGTNGRNIQQAIWIFKRPILITATEPQYFMDKLDGGACQYHRARISVGIHQELVNFDLYEVGSHSRESMASR